MIVSVFCDFRFLAESTPISRMLTTSSGAATMATGVGVRTGVGLTAGVSDAVGLGGRGVANDVAVAVGPGVDVLVVAGVASAAAGKVANGTATRGVRVGDGLGNGLLVALPAGWAARVTGSGAGSAPQPSNVLANSSKRPAASSHLLCWYDPLQVSRRLLPGTFLGPGLRRVANRNITCIDITFQYRNCQR